MVILAVLGAIWKRSQYLTKVRTGLASSKGHLLLEEDGLRTHSRRLLAASGTAAAGTEAEEKPGRPRADDRAALEAIVSVLRSGIPWEMLSRKQFGLSGMTAWRQLEVWTRAGVWNELQRRLLDDPPGSKRWALTGPNPADRAKAGSNHHLLVDAQGLPLTESVEAANVHDTYELFPLVDSVPAVRTPPGSDDSGPESCTETRSTCPRGSGVGCGCAASRLVSRVQTSNPRSGWDATTGLWSAHSPGRTSYAAVESATSTGTTSTSDSS